MSDEAAVRLDSRGGEVWDFRVRVQGTAGGADFAELALLVGDRAVPFAPRRGHFDVEVPLQEGEDAVRDPTFPSQRGGHGYDVTDSTGSTCPT